MILPEPFSVEICDWSQHQAALAEVRHAVFVEEQKVPREIELDELDAMSVHAIARDAGGNVIGTGRLILPSPLPRIGRMAVLKPWRRAGVGAAILRMLCRDAKLRGYSEVTLNAQTHATPFYFKHGFLSHGPEFVEAGIPHQEMRKKI
ncbi:MAG: GNAT family N-acetyltransferase [Betaproteobacteria bacterium]|nr:GNAT family N-acetyltransferase [Betaproteobacteria bacterium]